MTLQKRVTLIENLFNMMDQRNASSYQIELVAKFKRDYPELVSDLEFCFEVLAGKHKLGYKIYKPVINNLKECGQDPFGSSLLTIEEFYKDLMQYTSSDMDIYTASVKCLTAEHFSFWIALCNREYKLGFSNKAAMITDKHCMLAKTYPEHVENKTYYIQEKLNGNRCIAYYEDDQWKFMSRSQKPMKVKFDMLGMNTKYIYDGEVMTANKLSNKDFSATSGAINSKYGDKSGLIYFIYDIVDSTMTYTERLNQLNIMKLSRMNNKSLTPSNTRILKVLDMITVHKDSSLNIELDSWLDKIVEKGGEGIMLRDPNATYHRSKNSGDRKPCLLKYKKTKTCDLRIVDWNEGKGKYIGMIGSFKCQSDDGQVEVNVAGITDEVRMSNPNDWIGTIIEVAYFEGSKAKNKTTASLQFPRMKRVRVDKTETSIF